MVALERHYIRQGDVGASEKSGGLTREEIAKHLQMVERLESMGVCS